MKWIITLLFPVIMTTGYSQVATKDEMVKKIFATLKNKDEDGFVKLFPDAEIMKGFLKNLFSADTSDKGKGMAEMMNEFMEKIDDSSLQAKFRKDFKRYIKKGEEKGIDWPAANLQSYNADSALNKDEEMPVSELNGKIYFNSLGKEFFLRFEETVWFANKGWYGVDIKRIDDKSKENEPDGVPMMELELSSLDSAVAMDSSAVAVDSIAVASPPPAKTPQPKKVTKSPSAKPKPKTQTPLKKPE